MTVRNTYSLGAVVLVHAAKGTCTLRVGGACWSTLLATAAGGGTSCTMHTVAVCVKELQQHQQELRPWHALRQVDQGRRWQKLRPAPVVLGSFKE